jgi:hypothetical protein
LSIDAVRDAQRRRKIMQAYSVTLDRFALAAGLLAAASAVQGHEHQMIKSTDLTWSDVPSLPPGAKIAGKGPAGAET